MNRLLAFLSATVLVGAAATAQVGPGYSFAQTTGTYVPITGGTLLGAASGTSGVASLDDVNYAVTLPFAFTFDSAPYTTCTVNTNGGITFGATLPSTTNYTPLSATTAYNGAISAFGRDMQGGWVTTADRVTATNVLTNVANVGPMQIGDFVSGTGISAGTTIAAIAGNTVTLSANVTSTGNVGTLAAFGPWAELRHETLGSSPNRVFVVQWTNFKPFGTSLTSCMHVSVNYQIRLSEGSNLIETVYGNCSPGTGNTSGTAAQVGLRGPNNTFPANVNNRMNAKGTSDWDTSVPGTSNTSGELFNTVAPANVVTNGLVYTWTPVLLATNIPYGAGCGALYTSVYETMTSAAFDLANSSVSFIPTAGGYALVPGFATFVPPSGAAAVLATGDDGQATATLSAPFNYPGGSTTGLSVCGNGFVSVASQTTMTPNFWTPNAAGLLASAQTAWFAWHDFNQTITGSGAIKFEEIGGVGYVTWDGVWDYGGTSVGDASTLQWQFDTATGMVHLVFGSVSLLGASTRDWAIGYSPGGANLDPASIDFSTSLPVTTQAADVPALALSAAPTPVLGNTVVYTTSNIPATAALSAHIISLGQVNPGLPLPGAPGCVQLVDLNICATTLLLGSPTATFSFGIPNDSSLIGLPLANQSASLVPGFNALGVITSNGLKSTVSNL